MSLVRPFQGEQIAAPRNLPDFRLPEAGRPLDIEIGCGVGWHPIRYATENPERFLVAIEHTRTRFARFEGRLARHAPIANLHAVHADAVAWVTHFVPLGSVDRYFFLYPNPRPRPWYSMPFFGRVVQTLKPGGSVLLATNELDYHREARAYFVRAWGLRIVSERKLSALDTPPPVARTHFEKKYLARGQECFELLAQRLV
jgi:tRNA G46 methylase TrmB